METCISRENLKKSIEKHDIRRQNDIQFNIFKHIDIYRIESQKKTVVVLIDS